MIKKEREKERKKGREKGRRGGKGRKTVQGSTCRNNIHCGSYALFVSFGFVFCLGFFSKQGLIIVQADLKLIM